MAILLNRRPDTVPLALWRLMTWVKVWALLYVIAWVGYGVFSVIMTSSKLAAALDVTKEDKKTRERYGTGKPYKYQYDGAPTVNEHLLIARRLVEAGARSVTLSFGRWDSHGQNFNLVRDHGGKLDQCVSALVQDLEDRRMLDDVTVIVWGEFGRTPRINKGAGRDHWPQVSCALLAGGGVRGGQVYGETTQDGGRVKDKPVTPADLSATILHHLGIDPGTRYFDDFAQVHRKASEGTPVTDLG